MANRRIAVVIGVNSPGVQTRLQPLRYADRDADAITKMLCDPDSGTFDPGDVVTFSGPDVHASEVKATLRRLVRDSHETDLLVFYFAGHTVAPQWGYGVTERYLVTADLDEAALVDDPEAGLRMTFLTADVLEHFKGTSVLILDCCQAGGLATLRSSRTMNPVAPGGSPRAVLAACSADSYAREDVESQHGAFTRLVLEGLAGEAADKHGLVTFENLSTYVREQKLMPPPVIALEGQATILLTRPGKAPLSEPLSVQNVGSAAPRSLGNPLDHSLSDLTRLVDRLARKARTWTADEPSENGPANVELIRSALDADSVAHVRRADNAHGGPASFVAIDRTAEFDLDKILPVLWACDNHASRSRDREVFGYSVEEDDATLWCVPLGYHKEQAQFLIVVNPPVWVTKLGQMAAKALQAIWHIGFAKSPAHTELTVFTALRTSFRLPEPLFRRSLDLYSDVLTAVRIVFQPIVTIGRSYKEVGIHGYEALARQSLEEQSAPASLLKLAHTWGDHFVVERDKIILAKALTAYALAHSRSTWNQDTPKPVSINVSVRSLLNDAYVDTLRQLISDLELPPHVITLEISEQDAIEPWEGEDWGGGAGANHSFYNGRLVQVAQDLGVSFALDDFGTGHAALERITGLPITHIKIDRTILFHRQAIEEISLVVSIARDAFDRGESHASRPVIVEGVERDCPVSLNEIYATGIKHIQGYITEQRGAPDLRHLSLEVRNDIAARVRGEDDRRPAGVTRGDPATGGDSLRRTA